MTFTVRIDGLRPFTLNGERKLSVWGRAELVRTWREAAGWAAKIDNGSIRHQRMLTVDIVATPHLRKKVSQDTAGCFPAVKAAIDGLVDVGMLPSDGPDVVRSLRFNAPVFDGTDGLVLELTEVGG